MSLIHPYDVLALFDKIKEQSFFRIVSRSVASKEDRVLSTWKHSAAPVRSWTDIPAVQRRINQKITGNDAIDHISFTAAKYLSDGGKRSALSLGCGTGGKEIRWAKTGIFSSIDAVDISAPRIAFAKQMAMDEHLETVIHFSVGNVPSALAGTKRYDVVIAEGILHHLTPIGDILQSIRSSLKEGGILVINDFVGPSRFQWTIRQMTLSNALLSSVPDRLKVQQNGKTKRKIHRPGILTMYLYDPSEAVQSDEILKYVSEYFSIIESKPYGGNLLHLLFKDIAHHFVSTDDKVREILEMTFHAEDEFLASGTDTSDFIFLVCTPKK